MNRKQKHVLLVFGWDDHRVHQSIAEYAQEQGWHQSANLAFVAEIRNCDCAREC